MQIVHVHVNVKPEFVEAFKQATVENASNSVKDSPYAAKRAGLNSRSLA